MWGGRGFQRPSDGGDVLLSQCPVLGAEVGTCFGAGMRCVGRSERFVHSFLTGMNHLGFTALKV